MEPQNLNHKGQLADLYSELYILTDARKLYRQILRSVFDTRVKGILNYNIGLTYFKERKLGKAAEK